MCDSFILLFSLHWTKVIEFWGSTTISPSAQNLTLPDGFAKGSGMEKACWLGRGNILKMFSLSFDLTFWKELQHLREILGVAEYFLAFKNRERREKVKEKAKLLHACKK